MTIQLLTKKSIRSSTLKDFFYHKFHNFQKTVKFSLRHNVFYSLNFLFLFEIKALEIQHTKSHDKDLIYMQIIDNFSIVFCRPEKSFATRTQTFTLITCHKEGGIYALKVHKKHFSHFFRLCFSSGMDFYCFRKKIENLFQLFVVACWHIVHDKTVERE